MVHILEYVLDSFSSCFKDYHPKRIIEKEPNNESSRWVTLPTGEEQFVVLRLHKTALITSICFGKYIKPHYGNLKRFKILVGPRKTQMKIVLETGLVNNTKTECFYLENKIPYPIRYIKIIPMQTYGGLYSFSIWNVELWGVQDIFVLKKEKEFQEKLKVELNQKIIKYLKEEGSNDIAELYSKRKNIFFEENVLTKLHTAIVLNKDMKEAENIVLSLKEKEEIFEKKASVNITANWEKITTIRQPCSRGGHQLVYCQEKSSLFLFGGWDGIREFSDLWRYELKKREWFLVSEDTKKEGGPSARSCHRMIVDTKRNGIYFLGRFSDMKEEALCTDFYFFDLKTYQWTLLSKNVSIEGGPSLIYCHQIVYDENEDRLIVFGGRIVSSDKKKENFSGLFFYDIKDRKWTSPVFEKYEQEIITRSDHVMYHDPQRNLLYVCLGRRKNEFIGDVSVLNSKTGKFVNYFPKVEENGGPLLETVSCGAFDFIRGEAVFFVGWLFVEGNEKNFKPKNIKETFKDTLWLFDGKKWIKIKPKPNENKEEKPSSRYASQFVYCKEEDCFYLFGGTIDELLKKKRANDLWKLKLERKEKNDSIRKILFLIRKEIFKALAKEKKEEALLYLRTKIKEIIDLDEEEILKELSSFLFTSTLEEEETKENCFEEIAEFFSKEIKKSFQGLKELLPL